MKKTITSLVVALVLFTGSMKAQTSTTRYSSTVTVDTDAGFGWTVYQNPPIAVNFTNTNIGVHKTLKFSNFGFNIPLTATITGVEAIVGYSMCIKYKDSIMQLMVGGTASGNNNGGNVTRWYDCLITQLDSAIKYGSSTDLWGLTLTPAVVNNSNFGFALKLRSLTWAAANGVGESVNNWGRNRITIYYTNSSTGIIESQGSSSLPYYFDKSLYLNKPVNAESTINIYNLYGENVLKKKIDAGSDKINLNQLSNGVYIYKLKIGDNEFSQKIIIE